MNIKYSKIIKWSALAYMSVCISFADQNNSTESNQTKPPIMQFIDDNLMTKNGSYTSRPEKFVALYFFADWCPASRQMAHNVVAFDELFGDKVSIVAVNAGDKDDWFFGRYRIPWKTTTRPARQDLIDHFSIRHIPKFILLNEQGALITGDQFKKAINYEEN